MFTYKSWENFCSTLKDMNIRCITVKDVTKNVINELNNFVIIKHDIETNVKKALDIATIENKYNVKATYYFQGYLLNENQNVKMMKSIKELGHEIGYHYDVLDENRGDFEKAYDNYINYIKRFKEKGIEIESVCPHGNPVLSRNGWESNASFLSNIIIRNRLSIAGYDYIDAIVDIKNKNMNNLKFISDASYSWNNGEFYNIDFVINYLIDNNCIFISTHPHRWSKYPFIPMLRSKIFIATKKVTKILYKNKILKLIFNKYYHLAKKI